jgi:hypothetical protein
MMLADTPLDPNQLVDTLWAVDDLPDYRLWVRLHRTANMLFERFDDPTTSRSESERRGAQRFWNNPRVPAQGLADRAVQRTLRLVSCLSCVVLAHDTSEINKVGHSEPDDAGPLRSDAARGYLFHGCVAVDPATGALLGVIDAQVWTRGWRLRQQDHKERLAHHKESIKWRRGVRRAVATMKRAEVKTPIIHVFDREGDVHENLTFARRHRHQVLTRAAQNRSIAEGPGKLWAYMETRPVAAEWKRTVRTEVSATARKAAEKAGAAALAKFKAKMAKLPEERTAQLQLRFASVTLCPTKNRRRPVQVNAIWVSEKAPPAGVKPIEWMLFTTCPVTSVEEARAVVGYYEDRWGVEEVIKVLKTGLHLEKEAVKNIESFRRLVAVLMPLSAQMVQWTYAARTMPLEPASKHVEPEVLQMLKEACRFRKLSLPRRAWTIKDTVLRLALLGGYEARPGRDPGWLVIWRGWRELMQFWELFSYTQTQKKPRPS